MSFLKKAFKAVGGVVKDISKASIALPLESYGSITGKKTNITYETKVGGTLGKGAVGGLIAVHAGVKVFANGVTGGYASKALNKLRPADAQEKTGSYSGSIIQKGKGIKEVDKLNNFSMQGAKVIGSVYGAKVAKDNNLPTEKKPSQTTQVGGLQPASFDATTTMSSADLGTEDKTSVPVVTGIVGFFILVLIFLIAKFN